MTQLSNYAVPEMFSNPDSHGPDRPEFQLLLACSRYVLTPEQALLVRELAGADLNWDYLLTMANWHGVLPMLSRHLTANSAGLPVAVSDLLRDHANRITCTNLALASTLIEISAAMHQAGIDCLPYKGPALALRLYDNIALRVSSDLDIVVRKEQVVEARDCLNRLGFEDGYGLGAAEQSAAFLFRPEHSFVRGKVNVDLHWRIVSHFVSPDLRTELIWSRVKGMEMFGHEVLTFSDEDLLFVLALHAAQHEWLHLKWFCDIAELLRQTQTSLNWSTIRDHLVDRHTERCVLVSLEIVRRYWGVDIPPGFVDRLDCGAKLSAIATKVYSEFWPLPTDPTRTSRTGMRWLLERTQGQGWTSRARLAAATVFWPTVDDFQRFRLPRYLVWFYPALRLLRLFAKYANRGKRSAHSAP